MVHRTGGRAHLMGQSAPAFVIGAPASGSGKTLLTLALLRHFRNAGLAVSSFKVGPDYVDPTFHAAASGRACTNLDPWAMRPETLLALAAAAGGGADLLIGEGVMGLFDGAPDGTGSTADLAVLTGWPVILVVDVGGQAASAAAVVHGFASYRPDVGIAGVVFNRVGGSGHVETLREACAGLGIPVLGAIPTAPEAELPERHLGLVPAHEHGQLDGILDGAARLVGRYVDTAAVRALARPAEFAPGPRDAPLPALGRRIAVARDAAFAFSYPFVLEGWRGAGAEIMTFSPLDDEAPDAAADAVYLPGGYPELHAPRLAANAGFLGGLRAAAARGATVYGECGGYMVLGEVLIDAGGVRHAMAGLLALETSFAERRLHLGYRQARLTDASALGVAGAAFRGHEFHYAAVVRERPAAPLFQCRDARGRETGATGARRANVMGSFIHLIDRA